MRNSSVTILSRASDRTRAISASSGIGLVRKSSAPASSPRTRSDGWSSAVTITTGMWCVARIALEPPAHLEPVHIGHHHVEQNEVAFGALADRQRLLAAHGGDDVEIFRRQPRLEQPDVGGHIVNDEYAGGHR